MYEIDTARALAREVNEEIERVALRFESRDAEFLCECGGEQCASRLRLDIRRYDEIRADGHFLVLDEHVAHGDRVVEVRAGYAVVR